MLRNSLQNPSPEGAPSQIVYPDNVITRQLDAITGGRSTVSLPPPSPIPPTSNEAISDTFPMEDEFPAESPRPIFAPRLPGTLGGFQGIDLATNEVLGDNGEAFALNDGEIQIIRKLCFEVAERATLARIAGLKDRLGL